MASAGRATLWIGHVIPAAPLAEARSAVPRICREMDEFLRHDAEKRLGVLAKTARRAGARTQTLLLRGVPYEAIGSTARRCRADLVVPGTHGRTGVSRLVVGSVAARVISTAPCPVLTVRSR